MMGRWYGTPGQPSHLVCADAAEAFHFHGCHITADLVHVSRPIARLYPILIIEHLLTIPSSGAHQSSQKTVMSQRLCAETEWQRREGFTGWAQILHGSFTLACRMGTAPPAAPPAAPATPGPATGTYARSYLVPRIEWNVAIVLEGGCIAHHDSACGTRDHDTHSEPMQSSEA